MFTASLPARRRVLLALAIGGLSGLAAVPAVAADKFVAVTAIVEHP